MIIEEYPAVPATTIIISALLNTLRMITQEALQEVVFDVMTHQPSAFNSNKMKQPLNEYLNLEHYCAPVIHPTTGEIIKKY